MSRLAARFWDATEGTVTVGGVDVASVDPEVLLRDYAIVFQDVLLFDDTVMGNIRLLVVAMPPMRKCLLPRVPPTATSL